MLCPICKSPDLTPGELVDVAVGFVKCGPDVCDNCGFIEPGPDPRDRTIEHYRACWAKNLWPHPILPEPQKIQMPASYQKWVLENVKNDGYGDCEQYSKAMAKAFPELTVVYGLYHCPIWGTRNHFWCLTSDDKIIDPTKNQFPSKGIGLYCITYYCDQSVQVQKEQYAHIDVYRRGAC